jgi:hypothetical protein
MHIAQSRKRKTQQFNIVSQELTVEQQSIQVHNFLIEENVEDKPLLVTQFQTYSPLDGTNQFYNRFIMP